MSNVWNKRIRIVVLGFLAVLEAAAQSGAASGDIGWPRQISKNGARLIYYQPQVDSWSDYKQLAARVAFSLTPAGGKQTLGVASLQAGTIVDKESRTVFFRDIHVESVRFPSLEASQIPQMDQLFRTLFPTGGEPIALDRLMADIDRGKVSAQGVSVRNDPPPIFYSTRPAILLLVEGNAVLAPIEKTHLEYVVNTNWDLFFDKSKKTYYLATDRAWLTASELKGPWNPTQTLPKDMTKLPANQNWDDVKRMIPPPPPSGTVPQIYYSNVPAELILIKGDPIYSRISGTRLLYVTNTDNDLFLDDAGREFYILISGRWFHAANPGGPWTYAGANLPADFSKIPANSPKSRVLASVPGTIEASDAVLLAQIPTTAIVNKAEVESKVKVTYDGQPQFKPIENTTLQYATNTQDKVIKVGDLYYLCFQGVWFMSTKPDGPWKTADSVPKEIYSIPPSSPVYNVTYVTQGNATDTTVESSHTAGYLGMLVVGVAAGLTIAYGTGFYYPPYVYWGPAYPYAIYRPWPATYGAAAVYNPWTGGFAVGRAAYGPYGAVGSSAWYNPATGRYGRSASVQGWYGGRTVSNAYNPWTGGYGHTVQGHNAYSQWGSSVATRGGQWVQSGHVTTAAGTAAGYRTSTGQRGGFVSGDRGTVARGSNYTYAGNDGNVYRRDNGGGWSKYDSGSWNQVDTTQAKQQAQQRVESAKQNRSSQSLGASQMSRPSVSPETLHGLNNSAAARERGQFQTQRFNNFHRFGGFRRR